MDDERRQAHDLATLALLTSSMENKDGICDYPVLLAMDLME